MMLDVVTICKYTYDDEDVCAVKVEVPMHAILTGRGQRKEKRGKQEMKISTMLKITKSLKVTVNELFNFIDLK